MDEPTLTVRAPGAEPTALDRQAWAAQPGAGRDIGELVPGRRGSAAPLEPVVHGQDPSCTHVHLASRDGSFHASLTREQARVGWVVYGLDDGPLPAEFGGPFRLFFPGVDACANLKDAASITFATAPGHDTRPR